MTGKSKILLGFIVGFAMLVFAGCSQDQQFVIIDNDFPEIGGGLRQSFIAGRSVQDRGIIFNIYGDGDDVVMIIGGIHGDERSGVALVRELGRHLRENIDVAAGRTVVVSAVVNPDGYAANTRYNANGVDLNRNFSTSNRVDTQRSGVAGEPEVEAGVLAEVIAKYQPSRIVSVHSPLACIDYDGDGLAIAEKMAAVCELEVNKLGSRPGSLGSYAGLELGVPIITFECTEADEGLSGRELWGKYGAALLAAIEGV